MLACFFILFLAMKCTVNMVIFIPERPPLYSAYFPYSLTDLDDFMCQAVNIEHIIIRIDSVTNIAVFMGPANSYYKNYR